MWGSNRHRHSFNLHRHSSLSLGIVISHKTRAVISDTAYTLNKQGLTIVPMDIKVINSEIVVTLRIRHTPSRDRKKCRSFDVNTHCGDNGSNPWKQAPFTNKAEEDIRQLITRLLDKGYNLAAYFLSRVSKNLFSYVYRWLSTAIVTRRVSSLIERMMREIARRLKRMAFGSSPAGAAKMTRIILKRFTSAGEWEKYWRKRLRINGDVILTLRSIKPVSPQPLGR